MSTARSAARDGQIAAITGEQNRIRENMKTVAPSTQYYERLLAKLNEQESSIESLQKERASLVSRRAGLQRDLDGLPEQPHHGVDVPGQGPYGSPEVGGSTIREGWGIGATESLPANHHDLSRHDSFIASLEPACAVSLLGGVLAGAPCDRACADRSRLSGARRTPPRAPRASTSASVTRSPPSP